MADVRAIGIDLYVDRLPPDFPGLNLFPGFNIQFSAALSYGGELTIGSAYEIPLNEADVGAGVMSAVGPSFLIMDRERFEL